MFAFCCCKDTEADAHDLVGIDTLAETTLKFDTFNGDIDDGLKVRDPDAKAMPKPPAIKSKENANPEKGCVTFSVPGPEGTPSTEVRIQFTHKPFGMVFDNEAPVIIKRTEGHAEELGIQAGWEIIAVEGSSVEGEEDFDVIWEKLCAISY
mmetsp:Transcript_129240/g.237756  ORF Transcript_129240/g.237756 Transcript_129240/m.237756 type:complete len:151 (+) Transcript_129240:72-524(+)